MTPTVNRQIAEEAAEWIVAVEEGSLSARDRRALAAWLSRSPDHVGEFFHAATLLQAVGDLPEDRVAALHALLGEKTGDVVARMDTGLETKAAPDTPDRRSITGRGRLALIAAALAVVVAGLSVVAPRLPWPAEASPAVYATVVGEQRAIPLEDGSVIHLNTDSRVEVHMTPEARLITLTAGEAFFDVASAPDRPFRVLAGDREVEAVGTAFNVYRSRDGLQVVVLEGVVAIAPVDARTATRPPADSREQRILVHAGEQAAFTGSAAPQSVEADLQAATSWRSRELVFHRARLDAILAEYNRYTTRDLVIADDTLGALLLSGTFDVDDPAALIGFLEATIGVEADYTDPQRIRLASEARP